MDDTAIIDLYWGRDETAIAQTDRKYGNYCRTVAFNILNSRPDSEECVNDTWLQAWNAMPPQRPLKLRAFLGKITRNLALSLYEKLHAKKRGGSQTDLALEELAEIVGGAGGPEQEAEARDLSQVLSAFLKTLDEEPRKMFVRRYWYLTPVKEIAAEFGCTESKVKMTLLRTREKLREKLAEEGVTV